MSPEDASTVHRVAEALGHDVVYEAHDIPAVSLAGGVLTHTAIPRAIVVIGGERFGEYRGAMAYLQALGVRDE